MPDIKDILVAQANAFGVAESALPLGQPILSQGLLALAQSFPTGALPQLPSGSSLGLGGGGLPAFLNLFGGLGGAPAATPPRPSSNGLGTAVRTYQF